MPYFGLIVWQPSSQYTPPSADSGVGIGLLTAIPHSLLFFLLMGWIATPQQKDQDTYVAVARKSAFEGSPFSAAAPHLGVASRP